MLVDAARKCKLNERWAAHESAPPLNDRRQDTAVCIKGNATPRKAYAETPQCDGVLSQTRLRLFAPGFRFDHELLGPALRLGYVLGNANRRPAIFHSGSSVQASC